MDGEHVVAQSAAQMRAQLEETRASLQASIHELREDVVERVDLRRAYQRTPGIWLAGAFMVGLIVGLSARS